MSALRRHWARIAVTLLPVLLALAHATGLWHAGMLERLDHLIYDVRLRATMPGTFDPRIVIVDVDDASLARQGQWPWPRDKVARLATELLSHQQAKVVGFDVMFVEPDRSSGIDRLRELADGPLRGIPGLAGEVEKLAPSLDNDAVLARTLAGRPVALGYYFTQAETPRARGALPATPLWPADALPAKEGYTTHWNGFGASLPVLAQAAPSGGFLNTLVGESDDGVIRSVPLIARYDGDRARPGYYESLALAVYRLANGSPPVVPALVPDSPVAQLESLRIGELRVPVDRNASVQVPFRGPGGSRGGSFRYVAAADVLEGRLAPEELKDKIVLVGATAPGLRDLRATPAAPSFAGVEVHANIVSALLDDRLLAVPDYAPGYEVLTVFIAGIALAIGLSLAALRAVAFMLAVAALLIGLNTGSTSPTAGAAAGLDAGHGRACLPAQHELGLPGRIARAPRSRAALRHLRAAATRRRDAGAPRSLQHARREQDHDRHVLRHARLHALLGADVAGRAAGLPQHRVQPPHRRHHRAPRHRRQVHGRLRHGLLGRAARDARPRQPRRQCRARHGRGRAGPQPHPPLHRPARDQHRHRPQQRRHERGRHGIGRASQRYTVVGDAVNSASRLEGLSGH